MPLVVKDRVKETTTTTGTGTITLSGAANGFQSFSVIGNGNTTYYAIVGPTEWEVGIGTYTASGTTLSRDTILESSNGGTAVNFSAGPKDVFCTYPAEKSVDIDTAQTLTNKTINGSNNTITNVSLSTGVTGTLPVGNGGTGATALTLNNVILGNGTSAVQFVAPGTSGNVLTSDGTTWASSTPSVSLSANNAFTGANTFYNSTGQTFGTATSTQDGIIIGGAANGSSSRRITIQPASLGANRTITLPDATGTVALLGTAQTFTAVQTLTDPAIIGTILEDVFTITDGAAFEVDPGNGSIQLITLGASRTPKATNFAAGESVTLMVDDGSAFSITWTDSTWGTGGVTWVGGTAPTLATTGYTVIEFWKVGTKVYGALVGTVA